MLSIHRLLLANARWADEMVGRYPGFFERLADEQQPDILWVGCADSRVPAERITHAQAGELFVERNIANLAVTDDDLGEASSVLEYAVNVLQIRHIIVCGHSGCGGVRAALTPLPEGMPRLDRRIAQLRRLAAAHTAELASLPSLPRRIDRLVELNVADQLERLRQLPLVRNAVTPVALHGWVFDLANGRLRSLCGEPFPRAS